MDEGPREILEYARPPRQKRGWTFWRLMSAIIYSLGILVSLPLFFAACDCVWRSVFEIHSLQVHQELQWNAVAFAAAAIVIFLTLGNGLRRLMRQVHDGVDGKS